ncbi:DUF6049 family protein [Kitasatospora sp. DSM 101779]|uniref:DUF6049 family protein n=1 Tax=Kitasatospora sp. DSM 101779 TaxID=2853165 RepID=UPI0021D9D6B9|nr:DUF6049 family protein [Kitasatospora sp. DSM 101779]MCU7823680.1 hypothetical protein [Kitasatospora sp. DSM 101779]
MGRAARRLAAVLAGSTVLLSAAPYATAAAPARTAFPAASPDYPATVQIDSVSAPVAGDNATVTVTGRVTNAGSSTVKAAHVVLRSPKEELTTRSAINLVAGRTNPTSKDGTVLPGHKADLGDLAPGQSRPYVLQVSTSDLGLRTAGVYELAVDVRDTDEDRPLGIARTFLPYNTAPSGKQTRIATLWPITHAPELVAQTMPDDDQMPVLRDDSLTTELAPNGRLGKLVSIGQTLPNLTWVIDPDLLDTVYAMTKPYRVQKPGTGGESAKAENTVAGTGQNAATAWLAQLRTAVAANGSQVVALPYADPDLASIAHNGSGLAGMDTALRKASTAGKVTAEGRLSVDVSSGVAWPYQGRLDQQTAGVARTTGADLVLVNGSSMPESRSLAYTPNAARPIGNGQTAVVADPVLSSLFSGDLDSDQAQSLAEQRFLAETMTITQQRPDDQRSLLVMPSRTLTVGTAEALADALHAAAQPNGWVAPTRLDAVATAPADPDANGSVPGDYPGDLRGSELSPAALSSVMGVQTGLDQLLQILTQPQRVRGPFNAAMVRSMSTEWRDHAESSAAYRDGVQSYLVNLTTAVKVPAKSAITLPGDNAILLISVKNDLNQAVGNLELRVTSSQVNRLNVGQPATVVLDGTTSRTFRFPAEAQVNGPVQMTAQLWTTGPNAQPYGKAVSFTVEVTSVASGVMYVIGGGVVLMALAGVRFYLQRKKRSAAGEVDLDPERLLEPEEAEAEGETAAGGETGGKAAGEAPAEAGRKGPGEASDSTPESAADARDRATGDEKVGH